MFRTKTEKFDPCDDFFRFVRRVDGGVFAGMVMEPVRDFSTDNLRPYNVTERVFDGDRARTFFGNPARPVSCRERVGND